MSDKMHPVPLGQLLSWVFGESRESGSVLGIPRERFFRAGDMPPRELFGEQLETLVGPAAGPHTQLAQNIAAAYLCGARFFELKTVQILDSLEFPKPCIHSRDECYNTEWSTELSVAQAQAEYVKAWCLLHVLAREFSLGSGDGFVFNMSIGYDLEGIRSPKVDRFIEGLKDARDTEIFGTCLRELADAGYGPELAVSPSVCHSVTLSTMHGCPPGEIESICRYLLEEKGLHTFVKMNPTLLGYQTVRRILDDLGYGYISLREESFTHDLQYPDGMAMLRRLQAFAGERGREFGVKLSNTLPVAVLRSELPGEEMYMSGRSLYPLTVELAARIAEEFGGDLPVSYCGGADAFHAETICGAGVWPVTVATTLLKPGGYLRLGQMAPVQAPAGAGRRTDPAALRALAEAARTDPACRKETRIAEERKVPRSLGVLDCDLAPCTVGCPIGQDVPGYAQAVARGEYREALEIIMDTNPLPGITGTICHHPCMAHCTRLDHEEPVRIRELKLRAFREAGEELARKIRPVPLKTAARAAVVGAGPAGLSLAWFLRRAGMDVEVFEKEAAPGGTISQVIPEFRIPGSTVLADYDTVRRCGVRFSFETPAPDLDTLLSEYRYVYLAIGAGGGRPLDLEGDTDRCIPALEFLRAFRQGRHPVSGRHAVVAGGGNTAMDAARALRRLEGVESVTVVYRRTLDQMPADREEREAAAAEGVALRELLVPIRLEEGVLHCSRTEMTEPDGDSRPGFRDTGVLSTLPCDLLISAIGETVDRSCLASLGLAVSGEEPLCDPQGRTDRAGVYLGGDARRGPASVVEAIADSRAVAREILEQEGLSLEGARPAGAVSREIIRARRGILAWSRPDPSEGERCLQCGTLCGICTEVCPNRANVVVPVGDSHQILHLDALCNECGNCTHFCPYQGDPYKDKMTLFWREEDLRDSDNPGFLLLSGGEEPVFRVRLESGRTVPFGPGGGDRDPEMPAGVADLILAAYRGCPWLFAVSGETGAGEQEEDGC